MLSASRHDNRAMRVSQIGSDAARCQISPPCPHKHQPSRCHRVQKQASYRIMNSSLFHSRQSPSVSVMCLTPEMTCVNPHHVRVPGGRRGLDALGRQLIDGASASGGRLGLGQLVVNRTVDCLLEDRLGLVDLKLGLEVLDVVEAGRVGSATGVGKVELIVEDLLARVAPITGQRICKAMVF